MAKEDDKTKMYKIKTPENTAKSQDKSKSKDDTKKVKKGNTKSKKEKKKENKTKKHPKLRKFIKIFIFWRHMGNDRRRLSNKNAKLNNIW